MDESTQKAAELFQKLSPEGRKMILSLLKSIQPEEMEEKKDECCYQGIR